MYTVQCTLYNVQPLQLRCCFIALILYLFDCIIVTIIFASLLVCSISSCRVSLKFGHCHKYLHLRNHVIIDIKDYDYLGPNEEWRRREKKKLKFALFLTLRKTCRSIISETGHLRPSPIAPLLNYFDIHLF